MPSKMGVASQHWTDWTDWTIERFITLKAKCRTDGWMGWLSFTAVTPRASLKSDANKRIVKAIIMTMMAR